ncbi:sensor domain-containing diguanylate cyclase [Clostridium coskatii]|uniref:Response regulator PleD n=1 Tax=Clostridium coskatii TaxID=1705578 RepID=A0A170NN33_9CLOT|nr:diguanylate cyclase [Clostridium coskatii]OAA93251.1 Response regulator PleD [Clostridium coskatii]OBR95366.1 response regulator PleD [Clostridium coskatii]
MKKIILPIIFIALLVGIFSAFNDSNNLNYIKADKGILNLSNYNFQQRGNVKIEGQLELYVNKLLNPEQVAHEKTDKYLILPDKLTTQLNGKNTGYMTVHLKVFLPKGVVYGLRIGSFLSASKIWVNGVLQGQVGQVGKSYEKEKSIYLPSYTYFTAQNGAADIVIQASNYTILYPVLKPMELGLKDRIMNRFIISASGDLIIVGVLLIVELLFLCLYGRLKNNKFFLYFSILCLFTQLRCLFLNERVIVHIFPNMPFELLSKTAAITYYLYMPIYVLLLKELFPDFPKKLVNISFCFSIFFTTICLITNNTFYDRLSFLSEAILIFIVIGILIFFIKKAKKGEGIISFVAFTALIATAANDVLINNGMIYGRYGFQVGMLIFAFLETYVIIMQYSDEIINAEKLKIENRIIYEKSIKDDLTGLYKRNYIEGILNEVIKKYINEGEIFSIMMFDVDYFKLINDNYGHLQGDKVLTDISKVITECIGDTGYAGRYGGEEFIVILPNTKQEGLVEIGERIRNKINTFPWEDGIKVTISGGLYENKSNTNMECIKIVDDLLYEAKNSGRNKIVV